MPALGLPGLDRPLTSYPVFRGDVHVPLGEKDMEDLFFLTGEYPARQVIEMPNELTAQIGERPRSLGSDDPLYVLQKDVSDEAWEEPVINSHDVYVNITSHTGRDLGETSPGAGDNLVWFEPGSKIFVRGMVTRPGGDIDINLLDVTHMSDAQIEQLLAPQFRGDPRYLEDLFNWGE